ncbi:hypothetical protein Zm00014a_029213 [Zea mays]|uniref:Uncharacterized protein n=1 Tax=Zea mays TaxID=4577 RepID=A0A317Y5I1_MAIZE|nr:hypothetical protein Zm00014a_029213 [Zea mays]
MSLNPLGAMRIF